ncbi:MAG: MFS transporter, partial [Alphaproteobacteria bacterium]
MTRENGAAPARATRREWIGLATHAHACMLSSMARRVLPLALRERARAPRPTANQLLWIVDIYGFMVAGFLIIMGSLGDRFGRRRILLIGAAAFGLASAFAAFAETAETLIVARALLGVAGATIGPSTLSLITSMFRDPGERTFAISLWIMSFSVGAIIGPVAGGILIEAFWWGAVFLACVPIMLALLVLGPLLLPEYRDPLARPIDAWSALLSLAAVLAVISGVKRISAYGADAWAVAAIAAGVALGLVFFRRQQRLMDPFVDMTLFARPVFAVSIATNALAVFFLFGAFVFTA